VTETQINDLSNPFRMTSENILQELLQLPVAERRELFSNELAKHELCALQKDLGIVRKKKYLYSRKPKYGNLPRALSLEQYDRFLAALPHRKFRLLVHELLFSYALRISEVHNCEILSGGLLRIGSEDNPTKTGGVDYLPIYTDEVRLSDAITVAKAHSVDYLRNVIRKAFRQSGVGIVYATSKDGRRLFQFSTHSFRHTAISLFGDFVKDEFVYTRFSRHEPSSRLGTVAVYRYCSHERLRKLLKECFGGVV